jgi:hypothetical protein
MDTQCTLTSAEGVVDLGYGAAIADEGITFAMAGDKNTMTVGADGEGMHSLHADNSGQVTVRLLKTSPTNAKLMNIYIAQKASPKKWGKTQSHLTMQVQVITTRHQSAHLRKHLIIQMLKMAQQWNGYSTQSKLI